VETSRSWETAKNPWKKNNRSSIKTQVEIYLNSIKSPSKCIKMLSQIPKKHFFIHHQNSSKCQQNCNKVASKFNRKRNLYFFSNHWFSRPSSSRGKGAQRSSSSIRSVAYYAPAAAVPDNNKLTESATFLHTWLENKTSVLRGLFVFLSSGGVFFSAQCHEKSMRAFLAHGGGSLEAFKRAALARPADVAPSSSDMEGLQ
jgi:hypothetical protein